MPVIEMSTMNIHSEVRSLTQLTKPREMPTCRPSDEFTRENLIEAVAGVLAAMINKKTPASSFSRSKTVFHAKKAPKISLQKYIGRIAEYTKCSDKCLLLALIYIDRVSQRKEDFNLDTLNVHRLILIAITSAAKYADEFYYANTWYAEVGGIDVAEFNSLEVEFLMNFVRFELFVNEREYEKFSRMLKKFNEKTQNSSTTITTVTPNINL